MVALLTHPRIRMFLVVSVLLGITLALLQGIGVFTPFDRLIFGLPESERGVDSVIWLDGLLILGFSLVAGIVVLMYGNEKGLLLCIGAWGLYLLLAVLSVRSADLLLPVTGPLAATLIGVIRVMGWGTAFLEREKAQINKLFGHFLDNEVLKYLIQNPELIHTNGTTKQLTILFADIRGFTAQSETLPPTVIIEMLRTYFRQIIPVIRSHGGTVDKLIGDGIMAFFGDPIPQPDHAVRAAMAALHMQQTMERITQEWQQYGISGVQIGIGLNTDEVVVGNIGSQDFCDYTVLGRGVNLASRLESKCSGGEIHVSQRVYDALKETFEFVYLGEREYKNIQGPVPVYRLIEEKSANLAAKRRRDETQTCAE
ncbi:hypothetical protein GF339_01715 [candidate division KSB3 bacterium]|uniref:Guanylate cyclase domain-containing protein n=1 Tax=candidate division KSB3 bacterium TaxID=2044937 RepID=A0A9D5JS55_9BACT|nr:hypothetical protein [candidate division KSB3 bacterium]MBD3323268.1 hypothetical protein [candidate division KSB3 bacterium]